MRTSFHLAYMTAIVGLASGCTSVKSDSLKTSGMSATILVTADGSGQTKVGAHLNVDTNVTDYVDLSAGDSLSATVNGQTQTLSRSSFAGAVTYTAAFSGQDAEGTQYSVALNRANDTSAPSSTCTIPKPFTITAPPANKAFSRATDDLTITYDPSGTTDKMSWSADGTCIDNQLDVPVAGDTGTFTIMHDKLVSTDMSEATQSCDVTISVYRTRAGQLDPHYGYGGTIAAQQVRTVVVHANP